MGPSPSFEALPRRRAFARFAWAVLAYTVGVVLFGAVVRITGSGAGCGQHWPTCQGDVVHLPRTLETTIELTHRVTSGLSILLVLALPLLAARIFPRGHRVRRAALVSLVLMGVEAAIGAVLVLFRLVAADVSVARALMLPLHLVNTSLLLGGILVTASGSIHETLWPHWPRRGVDWLLPLGLLATLGVSATGAVTALGDTLFPVTHGDGLAQVLAADHAAYAHFLRRMRVIHPAAAVLVAVFLLVVAGIAAERWRSAAGWLWGVRGLVVLQVGAGIVNVLLSAPGFMQVIHLGLAVALWLTLVRAWLATSDSSRILAGE